MLEYMHSRESAQKEESISHHGNRFKEIESIDQKKTSWCFSRKKILHHNVLILESMAEI